ncbi:hypothetical protein JAAARDRAFT_47672 [Jaapia argillacea MUCL 33604]|uniref:Uncharacterized protein n=1 Tax=Jaapia argillacea MUCL 33604 TaxID=933084 RepID=A0A067PSZ8_9AGAM|nr:hypothetical protein JAAARDRAFT_47672 [Jaapia argillacea MUCL 33604]
MAQPLGREANAAVAPSSVPWSSSGESQHNRSYWKSCPPTSVMIESEQAPGVHPFENSIRGSSLPTTTAPEIGEFGRKSSRELLKRNQSCQICHEVQQPAGICQYGYDASSAEEATDASTHPKSTHLGKSDVLTGSLTKLLSSSASSSRESSEASSSDLDSKTLPLPPDIDIVPRVNPLALDMDITSARPRPRSAPGFVSSPLNPEKRTPPSAYGRARQSQTTSLRFSRIASEDSQVFGAGFHPSNMLFYHFPTDDQGQLTPPKFPRQNCDSFISTSDDSTFSLSSDSKYPSITLNYPQGFVPYVYDPAKDGGDGPEPDDYLHERDVEIQNEKMGLVCWSWRGSVNVGALILLVAGLLSLFLFYPVLEYGRHMRDWSGSGTAVVNDGAPS